MDVPGNVKSLPTIFFVMSQCLCLILGCNKIAIKGTVFAKSFTAPFNPLNAGFLRTLLGKPVN